MKFIWDWKPEVIVGLPFRWYSLMFIIGFIIGSKLLSKFYKEQNNQYYREITDTFFLYSFLGVILGARFGHVFFYQWDYYSSNILEIFMPWKGGLASHGGVIGIICACLLFVYKYKNKFNLNYLSFLDKIVIIALLMGSLIRLGNFSNSEIIGNPVKNNDYGVVFIQDFKNEIESLNPQNLKFKLENNKIDISFQTNVSELINFNLSNFEGLKNIILYKKIDNQYNFKAEPIFRHPTQLYESFYYFSLFILSLILYKNYKEKEGFIVGIMIFLVFLFRFLIEFYKENQVYREKYLFINIGQQLSLPFIILGLLLIFYSLKKKKQI